MLGCLRSTSHQVWAAIARWTRRSKPTWPQTYSILLVWSIWNIKRLEIQKSMCASSIIQTEAQTSKDSRISQRSTRTRPRESSTCPKAYSQANNKIGESTKNNTNQVIPTDSIILEPLVERAHNNQTRMTPKIKPSHLIFQIKSTKVAKWPTQSMHTPSQPSTPRPYSPTCSDQPTKSMKQSFVNQNWNSKGKANSCWYFQATKVQSAYTKTSSNSAKHHKILSIGCCTIDLLNGVYLYRSREKTSCEMSHMGCMLDLYFSIMYTFESNLGIFKIQ